MSYRDDIDGILEKYANSKHDKSDIAHHILGRFDEIKGGLTKRDIDYYRENCFGLECVRKIVNLCADEKIRPGTAMEMIDDFRNLSRLYLMSKGYFPQAAEAREKRSYENARKQLRSEAFLRAGANSLEAKAKF